MTKKEMKDLAVLIADELESRQKEVLVGVDEASELTGLAVQTLYNRKDEIGFVKRGKRLYFKVQALEYYNRKRTS